MNSYRFILNDYHAIRNADIILDGLTVLAGLNGCGKSTISRWLYGFVRYSNRYDHIIDNETSDAIYDRNRRLAEVLRRIAYWAKISILPAPTKQNVDLEHEISSFQERVEEIRESILKYMDSDLLAKYGRELWNALGIDEAGTNLQENISRFLKKEQEFLSVRIEEADKKKRECSIADLYNIIEYHLELTSKGPLDMQMIENGTALLDHDFEYIVDSKDARICDSSGKLLVTDKIVGRFLAPMGLKRAIYIDSPMAVSNQASDGNRLWHDFSQMLYTPLKPMKPEANRIVREIILILGGEVIVKEDGLLHKEMRYVRRADGLNISIDDVATGMKTFSYILRLLQNGYIDSETLLIIDEPEAHLHPQWIVKFAKVLVLIHKLLGAKIMVASHDPDMVAAIHTMSETEGLAGVTNFYQATNKPGEFGYTYINSGNDISQIFESFNIALDRIDGYKSIDTKPSEKV